MISDKLYQLAFEYKKTKLWKTLWDTDIFAVALSDGQIGYISVMGAGGDHCALGVYIGSDGLSSYLRVLTTDPRTLPPLRLREHLLQQDCLQCAFENKSELSKEEHEETKGYARAHGIRITGKKAYPQFKKYTPNRLPWHLQTEKEQEILCQVLDAAIELSKRLEKSSPDSLGLVRFDENTREIPLLRYQDEGYVIEKTELPPETPLTVPSPTASNDVGIASLKKAKKSGIWECEIIRFPQPIQNDPEEIPFFPITLLAVESSSGYMLQVPPIEDYEKDPEHLLNMFIEGFLKEKICPISIKTRDARTYAFAESLCKRLKIKLNMVGDTEMPALDEAEENFIAHFSMDEEEQMDSLNSVLDTLLGLDERQLRTLPDEMVNILSMLAEQGILPDALVEKLDRVFSPTSAPPAKQKQTGPQHSYVISVSLGTGCYRHIQIGGGCTLLELHRAILGAFGFMDDHAHAFFMDNIMWSEADCYYVTGIERYYRTTRKYTLDQAGLSKDMSFKYVFDFGDEWTFQCRVLKVLPEDTDHPIIIKSKGEAPEQYPSWDDE